MALDPELIDSKRFGTTPQEGYDLREVDEFLDTMAAEARATLAELQSYQKHVTDLESHIEQLNKHYEEQFAYVAGRLEAAAAHEARVAELEAELATLRANGSSENVTVAPPVTAPVEAPAVDDSPASVNKATQAAEKLLFEAGKVAEELQNEADVVVAQAHEEAVAIADKAQVDADAVVKNAHLKIAELEAYIDDLEKAREENRVALKGYFEEQLGRLDSLTVGEEVAEEMGLEAEGEKDPVKSDETVVEKEEINEDALDDKVVPVDPPTVDQEVVDVDEATDPADEVKGDDDVADEKEDGKNKA